MVNPVVRAKVDLEASAARVESARQFARFQSRVVDDAGGHASGINIDLRYLAAESVLAFEDTHRLLAALQAREEASGRPSRSLPSPRVHVPQPKRTVRLAVSLQLAVAALVSAFLLEVIDPSPMALQAAVARASTEPAAQ